MLQHATSIDGCISVALYYLNVCNCHVVEWTTSDRMILNMTKYRIVLLSLHSTDPEIGHGQRLSMSIQNKENDNVSFTATDENNTR